jgi:DNA excision repair protein ERCC-4
MGKPGKEKIIKEFVVVADTREQEPFMFDKMVYKPLPAGDYTAGYPVEGRLLTFEKLIAIERKRIPELFAVCGRERERFENELKKLSLLQYKYIVIEGNLADITKSQYGYVTPKVVLSSLCSWAIKYNVPFIFAGRSARSVVYKLLEFFVKYNILGFKTIEEFERISRWEAI